MKYLLQGSESAVKIDQLLSMTKIKREPLIKAIHYHLCAGAGVSTAAIAFSVPQPNLTDAISTLNEAARKAEKYHEMRLYEKTSINKNIIYSDAWAKLLADSGSTINGMTEEEFNSKYLGDFHG